MEAHHIIITGIKITRSSYSLPIHGFLEEVDMEEKTMQGNFVSLPTVVELIMVTARVSSYLQNNKNTRILSLVFFSYLS